MKKVAILSLLLSISGLSYAQKGVELTLKYNESTAKYGVYAKPNFTQRNFNLGPSQITVVLPSVVANEKLRIQNTDGGSWEDNSIVYAPTVNIRGDYHGIATMGAKTDLIEGHETLLFSFSVSGEVDPLQVKLFENADGPSSSSPGMKGGDFANTLNDALSGDIYMRNYQFKKYKQDDSTAFVSDLVSTDSNSLTLYPNTTQQDFKIGLSEVSEDESVTMYVVTEQGREIMRVTTTKKNLEEKVFSIPTDISSQNLVVRVKTKKNVFGRRLILDRD